MVTPSDVRTGTFGAIEELLINNKPSYSGNNQETRVYSILSAYPSKNPIFPCIVINPPLVDMTVVNLRS